MLKRNVITTLILCMLICLVPTGSCIAAGNQKSYSVSGGKIYINTGSGLITWAEKSVTSAKIPKKISGTTVKGIGRYAFSNCKKLKSVTLPSTTKRLDEGAFYDCVNLKKISFPKGKKIKMGKYVFSGCYKLNTIKNIPKGTFADIIKSLEDAVKYLEDPEITAQQSEMFWLEGDAEKEAVFKDLANEITKGCKTDRKKARAICLWVVKHLKYESYNGLSKNPWDVYQQILEDGKVGGTDCFGYSRLTQTLLQAVGIPCATIFQDKIESRGDEGNHEFNIAYFDGRWRFIDTTDSDWNNKNTIDVFDLSIAGMACDSDHRADMIDYLENGNGNFRYPITID